MSDRRALVGIGGLGLGLALVVVAGRLLVDGRAALNAGLAAQARGDRGEAIGRYLAAARLYLPGSPHVSVALERLGAMAGEAERGGDKATARQAWEAVRAALLGTRSFYVPFEDRLDEADRHLAVLYAELEDPQVEPGASPEARRAWHAAKLARRPGPSLPYVLLALGGLGSWIGAAFAFLRRGLDAGLKLRRGPAIASGLAFAVGFALFLVGLRLA